MLIYLSQGKVTLVDDSIYEQVPLLHEKWYCSNNNYAVKGYWREDGRRALFAMHRIIWEHAYGPIPKEKLIDHINGDRLDNRLENLRVVSSRENNLNRKGHRKEIYSSKYPGVYWNKWMNSWIALIRINGRQFYLGKFDNEIDAALAYENEFRKLL